MATFVRLWESRHSISDDFTKNVRLAEVNKDRELRACTTIQAIRRGIIVRRRLKIFSKSCVHIQRIWRGFLARQLAAHISMLRDKARALQLWNRQAVILQKTFRAFHSRRYKHSFYERRAYLASVAAKDESVRELAESVADATYEERELTRHEAEQTEFNKLAKDLHHLVSTANTPGVFNSPYNVEPIKAFGTPVEAHLKRNFSKSKFLARHMTRALGTQRYQALNPHSLYHTKTSYGSSSGSYQHSSLPRPLDPIAERTSKRESRVA